MYIVKLKKSHFTMNSIYRIKLAAVTRESNIVTPAKLPMYESQVGIILFKLFLDGHSSPEALHYQYNRIHNKLYNNIKYILYIITPYWKPIN